MKSEKMENLTEDSDGGGCSKVNVSEFRDHCLQSKADQLIMYGKVPTSPPPTTVSMGRSNSSSPLPEPVTHSRRNSAVWQRTSKTAVKKCTKFMNRLIHVNQMDFEFAFWQMIYLFLSPSKVYRNVLYRKQTKNQYSRDDPAFLVLLGFWFIISSTGLSLVLRLPFVAFIKFLAWVVFIDCIAIGAVIATFFWFVANKYLRQKELSAEDVEWGFAFDVHLNAFFPPLLILHVFQLFFFNVLINHDWFIARLFGNTLWMIAVFYYAYITFLGYSSLPHLQKTQTLLYPLIPILFFYVITLISGINICRSILEFYHYRVY